MNVVWLKGALQSLRSVHAYIAAENPAAARRVLGRIEQATDNLKAYPLSGREGMVQGTRELVLAGLPYLIVYRVKNSEVQILRVFHSKQGSYTITNNDTLPS